MELLEAALLGILQGLTEFLPVSSSGHLALAARALDISGTQLALVTWLHSATLLAVVWVYRAELLRMLRGDRKLVALVAAGFLPTALIGLLARPYVEAAFRSVLLVGICFLVTSAALVGGEWALARCESPRHTMPVRVALVVGVAQALALLPGVSRSGITIAAALLMGVSRPVAAHYSFLVAIPVIGGAFVVELPELFEQGLHGVSVASLSIGFVAAFASGFWALRWLLRVVPSRSLLPFAVYTALAGLVCLLLAATA